MAIQLAAHLVQHISNKLNPLRDLCAAKGSQEWSVRVFEDLRKELRVPSSSRNQPHADHTRVRPVSGSERVVDVHIAEFGERLAEGFDTGGIDLDLVSLLVLDENFLLDVEPQVLEEDWYPTRLQRGRRSGWRKMMPRESCDLSPAATGLSECFAAQVLRYSVAQR